VGDSLLFYAEKLDVFPIDVDKLSLISVLAVMVLSVLSYVSLHEAKIRWLVIHSSYRL